MLLQKIFFIVQTFMLISWRLLLAIWPAKLKQWGWQNGSRSRKAAPKINLFTHKWGYNLKVALARFFHHFGRTVPLKIIFPVPLFMDFTPILSGWNLDQIGIKRNETKIEIKHQGSKIKFQVIKSLITYILYHLYYCGSFEWFSRNCSDASFWKLSSLDFNRYVLLEL